MEETELAFKIMGQDYYCAICGAPGLGPWSESEWGDDTENEDSERTYDPAIVSRESMTWIEDLRVLGDNNDGFSTRFVLLPWTTRDILAAE
jgi:hypothetical protein